MMYYRIVLLDFIIQAGGKQFVFGLIKVNDAALTDNKSKLGYRLHEYGLYQLL